MSTTQPNPPRRVWLRAEVLASSELREHFVWLNDDDIPYALVTPDPTSDPQIGEVIKHQELRRLNVEVFQGSTEALDDVDVLLQRDAERGAEIQKLGQRDAQSRKSGCWCDEYGHPCKACEDKQVLEARIAELERRLRIPFNKFPCAQCGGPHDFDTSIPSAVWNKVIRAQGLPEYLCTTCIVREFAKAGESFTAQLWNEEFNGVPIEVIINGKNANDAVAVSDENNELRNQLAAQRETITGLRGRIVAEELASAALQSELEGERDEKAELTAEVASLRAALEGTRMLKRPDGWSCWCIGRSVDEMESDAEHQPGCVAARTALEEVKKGM